MRGWIALGVIIGCSVLYGQSASAIGLRIAPQSYHATLAKGESKKGFVDITNTDSIKTTVAVSVQGFRQIADDGSLEFFASEPVQAGVMLDYSEVELGPHQTIHLAFLLDGAKLPSGDVYAAIFASTVPSSTNIAAASSVRVGTLLSIVNGTPGARQAEVDHMTAPFFQFGSAIDTTVVVKNTANIRDVTGFYPDITMTTWPFGSKTFAGPLVFAGRTRTIEYRQPGDYLGLVWVQAQTGTSNKGQLIFAATGYWRWLAPLCLVLLSAVGYMVWKKYHKNHRKHAKIA